MARVAAGDYPDGVAYASKANKIYVSDLHGKTDTVIDAKTNQRLTTIAFGGGAGNSQYDSVSEHIFVTVHGKNELAEIDPNNDEVMIVALNVTLFAIVTQAQQPSTRVNTQQPTTATPAQLGLPSTGPRRIQAVRATDAIKIDGLLDEPAWSLAQPATDFLQQQPSEGAPASERTEVRVLFDDKNIYFGIHASCSRPR